MKVSPDIDDKEINKISEVLLSNDVAAVIVSNTSDSTRDNLKNTQNYQKGGLSGKPIELKSTEMIAKFYNILKGRIKIIGVGGVDSGKSAYEKFLAGANYVQLYTGMVFRINIKSRLNNIEINGGRYDNLISDLGAIMFSVSIYNSDNSPKLYSRSLGSLTFGKTIFCRSFNSS